MNVQRPVTLQGLAMRLQDIDTVDHQIVEGNVQTKRDPKVVSSAPLARDLTRRYWLRQYSESLSVIEQANSSETRHRTMKFFL